MTEFAGYDVLARQGMSASAAYTSAKRAGMSDIDAIRMLRIVFHLTLSEAKEVMVVQSGMAESLNAHEQRIADDLAKMDLDD